jgi:hypothetical protein
MPVSVSYTAAAGLTQTYVASTSDVEFSISDVAILPEVEALGVITDSGDATTAAEEIAAYGVTTLTGAAGALSIQIAEPSQAGQEKVVIYTDDGNTEFLNHDGAALDTATTGSQNGILHLLYNGSNWVVLTSTVA